MITSVFIFTVGIKECYWGLLPFVRNNEFRFYNTSYCLTIMLSYCDLLGLIGLGKTYQGIYRDYRTHKQIIMERRLDFIQPIYEP